MQRVFVSGIVPPAMLDGPAWWFVCQGQRVLARETPDGATVPLVADLGEIALAPLRKAHYLGALDAVACYAVEVAEETPLPEGLTFQPLRGLAGRLADDLFSLAGRAVQIFAWDRNHQFCGYCGTATEYLPGERATRCPHCGLTTYPRLSPAVIVRVARGDELLLARNRSFVTGFYSILAGFVEPGESLEDTVTREVAEEVGIAITDLRYYGSQSWPYPNSLMIGFTANYASGDIHVDGEELADAQWFRWDALPQIPPTLSIARKLIDAFVAEREGVSTNAASS